MPELVIITGAVNSGKTTHLRRLIAQERALGVSVSGVIAPGVFKGDEKIGYDVEDVASGRALPLARTGTQGDSDQNTGWYWLSKKTLEFAKEALLNCTPGGVVFLDEVGPLELSGEGYASCIRTLLESRISRLYIVVREGLVDQVTERFLRRQPVRIVAAVPPSPPCADMSAGR